MMLGSVGQTRGFGAGSCTLFGLDHVLAMVAVGLWAGLAGGRQCLAVGLLREN
jgi:urease accessory protein